MQDNEIFKDGRLQKENLKVEVPFVSYLINKVLDRVKFEPDKNK